MHLSIILVRKEFVESSIIRKRNKNKNHIFPIDIVGYFWYDKPMKQRNTKQREVADMNLVTSKRKFIHKDDRMCMCCCCCKENI